MENVGDASTPTPPSLLTLFFPLEYKKEPKSFPNKVSKNLDSVKYDLSLFLYGTSLDSIGDT